MGKIREFFASLDWSDLSIWAILLTAVALGLLAVFSG
jgi:hypothetical protein